MRQTLNPIRIERLGADECRRLLGTQQVGRLGFVSDGEPDIQPVNYVLDGDAVVFATAPGRMLWSATRSPVAFEVDALEPATRSGWSVVIKGLAQEITPVDSPSVLDRLQALPLFPWPGGERTMLVRLPTSSITGRRVGTIPM